MLSVPAGQKLTLLSKYCNTFNREVRPSPQHKAAASTRRARPAPSLHHYIRTHIFVCMFLLLLLSFIAGCRPAAKNVNNCVK